MVHSRSKIALTVDCFHFIRAGRARRKEIAGKRDHDGHE
jgi:hypothetical protein